MNNEYLRDKDDEFWAKWLKANCIEKHKLVDELIKGTKMDKFPIDATLLNSYFEDLAEFLKSKQAPRYCPKCDDRPLWPNWD